MPRAEKENLPVDSPQRGGLRSSARARNGASMKTPTKSKRVTDNDNGDTSPSKIKRGFNTALPDVLVGRDQEKAVIQEFLSETFLKKQPGSLYISGSPGTGKTAVVRSLLQTLDGIVIFINCMTIRNSQHVFKRICEELNVKIDHKDSKGILEKALTRKGDPVLLILDELDSLDSKDQEILYTAMEWPMLPKSRLVLVGIANALDLTDRILPRLQTRLGAKPVVVNFAPYSKEEVVAVLESHINMLKLSGVSDSLDAGAVQLCARKIAAVAGDMRRALDMCRRAMDVAATSPKKLTPIKKLPISERISALHMMNIMSESRTKHDNMPIQQKVILCTVLLMVKDKKVKEVLFGKLHEQYVKVCSRQKLQAVAQSEFLSMCQLIESRGLLSLKKNKDTRNTKLYLSVNEQELEQALQDKTLLAAIVNGGILK